jgi:hypothetical protein
MTDLVGSGNTVRRWTRRDTVAFSERSLTNCGEHAMNFQTTGGLEAMSLSAIYPMIWAIGLALVREQVEMD